MTTSPAQLLKPEARSQTEESALGSLPCSLLFISAKSVQSYCSSVKILMEDQLTEQERQSSVRMNLFRNTLMPTSMFHIDLLVRDFSLVVGWCSLGPYLRRRPLGCKEMNLYMAMATLGPNFSTDLSFL